MRTSNTVVVIKQPRTTSFSKFLQERLISVKLSLCVGKLEMFRARNLGPVIGSVAELTVQQ